MVGDNQGTGFIYDRTDLFLGTAAAPQFLEKLAINSLLTKNKQKAASADALGKLQVNPGEYWIKHDQELRTNLEQVQELGAQIMGAGADPFTSPDPASQKFQKELLRLENATKFSLQIKDYHKFLAEKLAMEAKDGGDRYTEESKIAAAEYVERGLYENMDSGQVPPVLEVKRPVIDLLAYDSKLAKEAMSGDRKVEDSDIMTMAETSLGNPGVAEATASQLAKLQREDPEAFKLLQTRAQNEGMPIQKYMRYQQMVPHFRTPLDDFDFESVEKQMVPGEVVSSVEKDATTVATTTVPEKKIRSLATAIVNANPKYVQAGVKAGRFGSPDKPIEENIKAAIEYNVGVIRQQAASKYSKSLDESRSAYGGASPEQVKANGDKWLAAVRSDNPTLMAEAMGYLKHAKVPTSDGRTIKDFRIVPNTLDPARKGGYMIEIIASKDVKQTDKETGEITMKPMETSIMFDPRSPEGMGVLIDRVTGEGLLNMHDSAFKFTSRPFNPELPQFKGPAAEVKKEFIIID